mmetsp:Transcript_5190/g.8015  ORF Transcript_5190/g.8015 Transcript_5190/m.8015 type:complete len:128 (+) Transcript_5190:1-384(+)
MKAPAAESDDQQSKESTQIPISGNVIVMEREFKSKRSHSADISCMVKISETEFITSSDDMSFKVWDKDLQGCSYTYETHEPLYTMRLTGEKMNLLISALGQGNFIVMGLDQRNQHDIIPNAHDEKII